MKDPLAFTVRSTEEIKQQMLKQYMAARLEQKRRRARIRAKRKISIHAHKG